MTNTIKIANNQPHSWPFVYLHGKLEKAHKFDISNFSQPVLSDGIHACTYNGMHCLVFLWTTNTYFKRGLVVLINDTDALADAYQMYITEATHL